MKRPLPRTRASSSTRGSYLAEIFAVIGGFRRWGEGLKVIAQSAGVDRGLRGARGCGTGSAPRGAPLQFSGDEMATVRTIDIHTHILTQETAALLTKAGVKVTITPDDAENAAFDVNGVVYRPFPTGGFDIPRRLRDMDAAGGRRDVGLVPPPALPFQSVAGPRLYV